MKVSICIPAYRQVEFLRRTLRSIEAQEFGDYELIVSDDSPDDSVRGLLEEFSFDGRLRYVRNAPPLGSPANWNAALRLARGDYVKIQHHDDHLLGPHALRRFVELLDSQPQADFAFAASLVEHVDSGLRRVHRPTAQELAALRADPAALFADNFVGAPSATIVRNGLGLEYDTRMRWLVDIDYYYRILMRNGRFAYTPDVLVGTPTNAAHQVTETCRDDAAVELGEAMLLYEKLTPAQRGHRAVRRGWGRLFRRFGLREMRDFGRHGITVPVGRDELAHLLAQPPAPWELLCPPRLVARKVYYRLYPYLPMVLRRPLDRMEQARRHGDTQ